MKLTTALTALALLLAPSLSFAGCKGDHSQQTAMSCAEGMMMDEETGTCVPVASS